MQLSFASDEGLITLLGKFLQKTFAQLDSDVVERPGYRLDPQWLEPFLETNQIIDRVVSLADKNELTENQRTALWQFIREYEMRQQGKDPDEPWVWEVK